MPPGLHFRAPLGAFERSCFAALLVCSVAFGWSALRLVRETPLPVAAAPVTPASATTLGVRQSMTTSSAIRVVSSDPFHPQRVAAARRYVLPEDAAGDDGRGPGPIRADAVQLLGTAVLDGGGSFVMCQVGSATPQTVRIGEQIGDLTLVSVSRGEAEFSRRDGSIVTLAVPSVTGGGGSGSERRR